SPLVLPHLHAHVKFWDDWLDVLQRRWGLARRPRLEVVECALSDREGEVEMHLAELEMLSSLHLPSQDWIRVQDSVRVRCARLDRVLEEKGWSAADFNLLNIDVQGHELPALQGARETLGRMDAVVAELNHQPRYHGSSTAE